MIDTSRLPLPKPEPRRRTKARAKRQESAVLRTTRGECVERDGYCRFQGLISILGACDGPSEFAHADERMRSKTRGQAPEVRHDRRHALMLCRRHHNEYDGKARPRLEIEPLTDDGMDGRVRATRDGRVWEEA